MLKYIITLLYCLIASSAIAQSSKFSIADLSAQEIQIIGNALAERPYKEVAVILGKLQKQIQDQEHTVVKPIETPRPKP